VIFYQELCLCLRCVMFGFNKDGEECESE
jgi:hypothetical protein